MVATDMYGKNLYGSGYTELRKSITFLSFLFGFLIINFYDFSYIFTLQNCSTICWDSIVRLIRLDMCTIFLFFSVIILFVYDIYRYGTAANVSKVAFNNNYLFYSLLFAIGGFAWYDLAAPDPLPCFLTVNNIIVCSEVSFS